jgi:tRNA1(Val) A37 N6-methylase TrmN6
MTALIFQRVARNYACNGYYPTDAATLLGVFGALSFNPQTQHYRLLDPCCGEGSALAEIAHHVERRCKNSTEVTSYGVEYASTRAREAKRHLDHVVHADIQACSISKRRFGLLFLNPPYGDLNSDSYEGAAGPHQGRNRLEKLFLEQCTPYLQSKGVLVYIIPDMALDRETLMTLTRDYTQLSIYKAPERRFRQLVIFGYRNGASVRESDEKAVAHFLDIARRDKFEVLPSLSNMRYDVPGSMVRRDDKFQFLASRLNEDDIIEYLNANPGMWATFQHDFGQRNVIRQRPLKPLSPWHTALALAAGLIGGVVTSKDGLQMIVKGATRKVGVPRVTTDHNHETGVVTTTEEITESFSPSIRGVVLSKERRGEIIDIT